MLLPLLMLIDFSRSGTAVELTKAQDPMGWIQLPLSLKSGLLQCAVVPIILNAKFQSRFDLLSLRKISYYLPNCFYLKLLGFRPKVIFFSPGKTTSKVRQAKEFIHTTLKADIREELVLNFCIFPSHF